MKQTQLTHTASGTSRLCKWHAVLIYSNGPKLDVARVARVILSHGALTSASKRKHRNLTLRLANLL